MSLVGNIHQNIQSVALICIDRMNIGSLWFYPADVFVKPVRLVLLISVLLEVIDLLILQGFLFPSEKGVRICTPSHGARAPCIDRKLS